MVQTSTLTNGHLAVQAMIELRVLVFPASPLGSEFGMQHRNKSLEIANFTLSGLVTKLTLENRKPLSECLFTRGPCVTLGNEYLPVVVQDLQDIIFRSVAAGASSLVPFGSAAITNDCMGSSIERSMRSTVAARTQAAVNAGRSSHAASRHLR